MVLVVEFVDPDSGRLDPPRRLLEIARDREEEPRATKHVLCMESS